MKNFQQVLSLARSKKTKIMAVACPDDPEVLKAIEMARKEGIAESILVGDESAIKREAQALGMDLSFYRLVDVTDPANACLEAVSLVHNGQADMVMKGMIDTSIILKAVLNKEKGLRTGKPLSHTAVFEVQGYDRLLFVTDAAMTLEPDQLGKKAIIENAVEVAHALGIAQPKVAVLCAKEKVDEKMPCTIDARALQESNEQGEISGCLVGGPFGLDNAISEKAALHKGVHHPVAGKADILLVPDIESGNILYKSMVYFANALIAGVINGASAPVVLTSRADDEYSKLYSIALAALLADKKAAVLEDRSSGGTDERK